MPCRLCSNGVIRAGNETGLANVPFFKMLDPYAVDRSVGREIQVRPLRARSPASGPRRAEGKLILLATVSYEHRVISARDGRGAVALFS